MKTAFDFRYEHADLLAVSWFATRKHWFWKGFAQYIGAMTVILFGVMLIGDELHSVTRIIAALLTAVIVGLGAFGLVVLWWFFYIPRKVRKTYDQLRLDGDSVHVECDDNELQMSDANSWTKVAWPSLIKWTENARFLLFYRTDTHCNYVPKDKVEPAAIDALRAQLVRANVRAF